MKRSPGPARSRRSTATRPPTSAVRRSTSGTWSASSPPGCCAPPWPGRRRTPPFRLPPRAPVMKITVTVNGTDHARVVEPRLLLIHFLRDDLGLTGSHWGCDTSNCGACVVWLDEAPVKSCTVLAVMADGRRVTTVEGLAAGGAPRPGPGGLRRVPRAAVRLLHARHDDDRAVAARQQPGPDRRRGPRGDIGPGLPVHRVREHRQVGAAGRQAGRCSAGRCFRSRCFRSRCFRCRGR